MQDGEQEFGMVKRQVTETPSGPVAGDPPPEAEWKLKEGPGVYPFMDMDDEVVGFALLLEEGKTVAIVDKAEGYTRAMDDYNNPEEGGVVVWHEMWSNQDGGFFPMRNQLFQVLRVDDDEEPDVPAWANMESSSGLT